MFSCLPSLSTGVIPRATPDEAAYIEKQIGKGSEKKEKEKEKQRLTVPIHTSV